MVREETALQEQRAKLFGSTMFGNLVHEMTSHVHFMFISHNKLALEMVDYLMGDCPMHMSLAFRVLVVLVNINQAIELAAA